MELNHEKVLYMLNQQASSVLNTFDEPIAVMAAIAWQPQLGDDIPFGFLKVKSNELVTHATILNCMKQTTKLQSNLVTSLAKLTEQANQQKSTNTAQEAQIHALKEEIRQLKAASDNKA